MLSVFTLHYHHADKAGDHYDLRLKNPLTNKVHSFTFPKAKIPTQKNELVLVIPTHVDNNDDSLNFSGVIPQNQYGAGKIDIMQKGEVEIREWGDKKLTLVFKSKKGPLNGTYHLIGIKNNNFLMRKEVN